MESGSEGGNDEFGVERQGKPKRKMKTPFQLETLERAYAENMYPSEATRLELSEKLNLTDRQLQMWFCHRRLKDKKGGTPSTPAKKTKKVMAEAAVASPEEQMDVGDQYSEQGSGSGPDSDSEKESSPVSYKEARNVASQRYMGSSWQRESSQTFFERRIVAAIEQQIGEPLQEDGPILGIEFDSLPPGAFTNTPEARSGHRRYGSPLEREVHQRSGNRSKKSIEMGGYGGAEFSQFYDFPFEGQSSCNRLHDPKPSELYGVQGHSQVRKQHVKQGHKISQTTMDYEFTPQRGRFMDTDTGYPFEGQTSDGPESHHAISGEKNSNVDALRKDKKRKAEDGKTLRDADEKRIRKELEKQEILRQKREEQLRKEMEKVDRERKKEEERLMREKLREEERILREQKKEHERREKFLQRESLKAERLRQKEELRKEREALRLKAAMEKATARRIVRESMGLIEDERLELMQLAVSSKGLESIAALDYDSLQNLEAYRDSLIEFPPKSVQLKKPFGVQPWIDSDVNIGNLLMVWRFFTTFADILELWPFTLDEFVQAFHDYDSRLLGEMHVALLKLMVKDIEDAARASQMASGTNQAVTVSPEGGHPHVVEGAYAWGFDVHNWKQHLSALTWPEILRQLALSAGFGPQLKKKKPCKVESLDDIKESKGSEDAVSILRNGSAAQNAIVKMQHRGLALPRKSRHRLTPGTVKFAAFHILSLEGGSGLTLTELAERIQKSGLRDLSSTKKAEASIGVALTRDTTLFERVAPSTYCVRSAYRKDPAEAESVISAAREKLQALGDASLPVEDADSVERDDGLDCDGAADKVDELGTASLVNEIGMSFDDEPECLGIGNDNSSDDGVINIPSEPGKESPFISSNGMNTNGHSISTDLDTAGMAKHQTNPDDESPEVDENQYGESWVQGLAEGDYSALSIEERLNALVALIGLANEGNTIRAVLEARLEAASALKKQMWAEAELDKKRGKDGMETTNLKFDVDVKPGFGGKSPMLVDKINKSGGINSGAEQKPLLGGLPDGNISAIQDAFTISEFASEQHKYAVEKSRIQLKSFISFRAEEMYAYRHLPLGQDRRHNRYWQFIASASKYDPGTGRIFVESKDGHWRLIDTAESFDALLSSLDTRGIRESNLHNMLKTIESSFKGNLGTKSPFTNQASKNDHNSDSTGMTSSPECASETDSPRSMICGSAGSSECSSSFQIELARNSVERMSAFRKYLEFEKWMWKECFEKTTVCDMQAREKRCDLLLEHCEFCHDMYLSEDRHSHSCLQKSEDSNTMLECDGRTAVRRNSEVQYSHLPLGVRLLKGLMALIEAFIPLEALQYFWEGEHRKAWGMKLCTSSSIKDLFKVLTFLETAIRQDCLSLNFKTTQELLDAYSSYEQKFFDLFSLDTVPELPCVPQTTAAVALRLSELKSSILFPDQDEDPFKYREMSVSVATGPPSRYISPLHNQMSKSSEANHKRPLGDSRNHRGKLQKSSSSSVPETSNRSSPEAGDAAKPNRRGTNSEISGWGNRIVRGKRTVKSVASQSGHHLDQNSNAKPPRIVTQNQSLEFRKARMKQEHENSPESRDNAEHMESGDEDDDSNASESDHGNWGLNFRPVSDKLDESTSEEDVNDSDASDDAEQQNFHIVNTSQNQINHRLDEAVEDSESSESDDDSE
ncbi:unnamed protein product [Rhodiola kirilowii]